MFRTTVAASGKVGIIGELVTEKRSELEEVWHVLDLCNVQE